MKQWTEEEINRLVQEEIDGMKFQNHWDGSWSWRWGEGFKNLSPMDASDTELIRLILQTRLDLENARKALERVATSTDQMGGQTWSSEIARQALESPKDAPHD